MLPRLDSLLASLVEKYAAPPTAGMALVGSHARGTAHEYSDIDLDLYIDGPAVAWKDRLALSYGNGYLISISRITLEEGRRALQVPVEAVEAVPGLRDMRILYDPRGTLRALQEEAQHFSWAPLQQVADEWSAAMLTRAAEVVLKVLGALERDHASSLAFNACGWLLPNLTRTVAVHRGVLVPSVNELYSAVQKAVGDDSEWTYFHRLLAGMAGSVTLREQALAALHLYEETVGALSPVLDEAQWRVAEETVARIHGR